MKNQKNTLITCLYTMGFIVSGSFTAKALVTLGQDKITKILLLMMVVIFEFIKAYMFFEYIKAKTKGYLILWITLVLISLTASMALFINQGNASENKNGKISTEVKMNTELSKINEDNIKNAQAELSKLNQTTIQEIIVSNETIKNLKELKQIAYDNNRITRPEGTCVNYYQSEIAKKEKELTDNYNTRKTQLQTIIDNGMKGIEGTTKNISNIDNVSTKDTTGYRAVLVILAPILNKLGLFLFNKWTVEELELISSSIISLILEIVICVLYYLKMRNKYIDLEPDETIVRLEEKQSDKNKILENKNIQALNSGEQEESSYKVDVSKKKSIKSRIKQKIRELAKE